MLQRARYKIYYRIIYLKMNRSTEKKKPYSSLASSRLRTTSQTVNSTSSAFKYQIVIKTTQNQVPQIEILNTPQVVAKGKDNSHLASVRMFLALQKARLKFFRAGLMKISGMKLLAKDKKISASKIGLILKIKQIRSIKEVFIKLLNLKRLQNTKISSTKGLFFALNKIIKGHKNFGLAKLRNFIKIANASMTQSRTKRSLTPPPIQQTLQNKSIRYSQKLINLCNNTFKQNDLNSNIKQNIKVLKNAIVEEQRKLGSSKSKQDVQDRVAILQLTQNLLRQLQNAFKKIEILNSQKETNIKQISSPANNKLSLKSPDKQINNSSNEDVYKNFEKIIETFNQCLTQDNYQKWEKFITNIQSKDSGCSNFLEKLQKLNDILNNKIEGAVAVITRQSQITLEKAMKQNKSCQEKLQGKIKQLDAKLKEVTERNVSKQQYNQVVNANANINTKIIDSKSSLEQILKTLEEKNKQIKRIEAHIQNAENKINMEQVKTNKKIEEFETVILNIKSTLCQEVWEEIRQLKKKVQEKETTIASLTQELESSKNSFLEPDTPKFHQKQIQKQMPEFDLLQTSSTFDQNEKIKQLFTDLEKECVSLKQQKQVLLRELQKTKTVEPMLNNVTTLQNVVLLLTNILSFISSKFQIGDNYEIIQNIFNDLTHIRDNFSENDQTFLQKCQRFAIDIIQIYIK